MASFSMASRCLAFAANARECRARHTRARVPGARSVRAARAPRSARLAIYRALLEAARSRR